MPDDAQRDWTPDPKQLALRPEVSGNAINGLDEQAFRRPSYVYWATEPDTIAHGQMQKWFYTVDPGLPEFAEIRAKRQQVLDARPAELGPEQPWSDGEFRGFMERSRAAGHFDKHGATAFSQDWAFEGQDVQFKNILILGFEHDYSEIKRAPTAHAGLEVMRQYYRAAKAAKLVADWLRERGHDAEALTGPMSGKMTMLPAAIEAGFGELGKHGSLITPEFGSSFRLSAVLTDAPVPFTARESHGIDEFCANCQVCSNACPPDAIFADKQMVRGTQKYYVDFDKCLPFFNEHQGCAICIAVCPWSRPGIGLNLAAKLAKRAERLTAPD